MGTRSTVKFYDREVCIMSVYQQYDGYVEGGTGEELGRWLSTKKIISGISTQTIKQDFANGMGCLAAQYIAEHKKEIGGLYMTSTEDLQEFNYVVRYNSNTKEFSIEINEGEEFTGTLQEFLQKYKIQLDFSYDEVEMIPAHNVETLIKALNQIKDKKLFVRTDLDEYNIEGIGCENLWLTGITVSYKGEEGYTDGEVRIHSSF